MYCLSSLLPTSSLCALRSVGIVMQRKETHTFFHHHKCSSLLVKRAPGDNQWEDPLAPLLHPCVQSLQSSRFTAIGCVNLVLSHSLWFSWVTQPPPARILPYLHCNHRQSFNKSQLMKNENICIDFLYIPESWLDTVLLYPRKRFCLLNSSDQQRHIQAYHIYKHVQSPCSSLFLQHPVMHCCHCIYYICHYYWFTNVSPLTLSTLV